jgi:hypothetical protein
MPVPDFSPGEVLTAAAMDSIGLWKVAGASFATVTAVNLPNDTFKTTYNNYRVVLQITATSGVTDITMRFRASGSDDGNNIYRQTTLGVLSTGTAANFTGDRTNFGFGSVTNLGGGFMYATFDINNMAVSSLKAIGGQVSYNNGTNHAGNYVQGQLNTAKVFDSISFIASGGFNITGNYAVYGYRT